MGKKFYNLDSQRVIFLTNLIWYREQEIRYLKEIHGHGLEDAEKKLRFARDLLQKIKDTETKDINYKNGE